MLVDYPWHNDPTFKPSLVSWLMLPSYIDNQGAPLRIRFLLFDLLQLLLASQQLATFHIERNDNLRNEFGGGRNNSDLTTRRHNNKGAASFLLYSSTIYYFV